MSFYGVHAFFGNVFFILIGQVEGDIPRNKVEKRVVRTRLVIRGTTK